MFLRTYFSLFFIATLATEAEVCWTQMFFPKESFFCCPTTDVTLLYNVDVCSCWRNNVQCQLHPTGCVSPMFCCSFHFFVFYDIPIFALVAFIRKALAGDSMPREQDTHNKRKTFHPHVPKKNIYTRGLQYRSVDHQKICHQWVW